MEIRFFFFYSLLTLVSIVSFAVLIMYICTRLLSINHFRILSLTYCLCHESIISMMCASLMLCILKGNMSYNIFSHTVSAQFYCLQMDLTNCILVLIIRSRDIVSSELSVTNISDLLSA